MRLKDFLEEQKISQTKFAARSGLAQTTIASIVLGGGTSAKTASVIISATGGLVKLEDLFACKTDRKRRTRSRNLDDPGGN
jgi:transcriptional regulator with XRE-family HTH domain